MPQKRAERVQDDAISRRISRTRSGRFTRSFSAWLPAWLPLPLAICRKRALVGYSLVATPSYFSLGVSMLGDITREGIEKAIAEFDRLGRESFLDKYQFGKARSYFVLVDDRRYDSKAICGAAHGYDRPDDGPLRPDQFSGGDSTVARLLENRGFEVSKPALQGAGWTEEERILALDLYLRVGTAGRSDDEVLALSDVLNRLAFHPDAGTRANFRNPNGVALKLANFAAIDPSYLGSGMQRHSRGDRETWDTYANDSSLLEAAAEAIRAGEVPEPPGPASSELSVPLVRPVESHRTDRYEVTPSGKSVIAQRRESELVQRFDQWLQASGARTSSHHYETVNPPLRSDIVDETARRVWEAKADVGRPSVRMALGQLLDYLRFEPSGWTGGVLLPYQPSEDLLDLILTSGRAAAWTTSETDFLVREPLDALTSAP